MRFAALASFFCILPLQAAECSKVVVSADPAYPPLHWYDGKALTGASIELTTRVLDELRMPWELRYLGPWPRVLMQAQHDQIDIVATLKETPERRAFLDFSHPAFVNPIAVFVRGRREFTYSGVDSLTGLRGASRAATASANHWTASFASG